MGDHGVHILARWPRPWLSLLQAVHDGTEFIFWLTSKNPRSVGDFFASTVIPHDADEVLWISSAASAPERTRHHSYARSRLPGRRLVPAAAVILEGRHRKVHHRRRPGGSTAPACRALLPAESMLVLIAWPTVVLLTLAWCFPPRRLTKATSTGCQRCRSPRIRRWSSCLHACLARNWPF
jgi:hypothetical protein